MHHSNRLHKPLVCTMIMRIEYYKVTNFLLWLVHWRMCKLGSSNELLESTYT